MNHEEKFDSLYQTQLRGVQTGMGERPREDVALALPDPAKEGARVYLRALRDLTRSIGQFQNDVKMYRSMGVRYAGMTDIISAVCNTPDRHTREMILHCIMLGMTLSQQERSMEELVAEGCAFIDLLPEGEKRTVLRKRYLRGESWRDICREMYLSNSWARQLEHNALKELDSLSRSLPKKQIPSDPIPWNEEAPVPQELPF